MDLAIRFMELALFEKRYLESPSFIPSEVCCFAHDDIPTKWKRFDRGLIPIAKVAVAKA